MKITVVDKTKREIEVKDFPVYREQDVSGDFSSTIIYMRVDKTPDNRLKETSITVRHPSEVEINVKDNYHFDGRSGEDYCRGQGEYKSSEERFARALNKARNLVDSI